MGVLQGNCGKNCPPYSSSKLWSCSRIGALLLTNTSFYRFSGTEQAIKDHIQRVGSIVKQSKGGAFQFARTEDEKIALWSARKEALWAVLAQRPPGTEIWSTDCAVPMSRLAEIIGKLHIIVHSQNIKN